VFRWDKRAFSGTALALVKGENLVKMNQTKGTHDQATHCPTCCESKAIENRSRRQNQPPRR
jgi:hypothetical protein